MRSHWKASEKSDGQVCNLERMTLADVRRNKGKEVWFPVRSSSRKKCESGAPPNKSKRTPKDKLSSQRWLVTTAWTLAKEQTRENVKELDYSTWCVHSQCYDSAVNGRNKTPWWKCHTNASKNERNWIFKSHFIQTVSDLIEHRFKP